MTDKELLRGEIRETIRLYRLGLNKKTLEALVDDMEAIFKQEIEGILDLNIFANKYSSRFVNKGILMAYDAIKEHIEGKKEEPKGEQDK